MASNNRDPSRLADARRARGRDIMAKLTQALRPKQVEPSPPLPTADEFGRLLDRFEREHTRAHCTYIWTGTWIEILALSRRLFVDKGDLCEFYARDYAYDLLAARHIEGLDEGIRDIAPDDSRVRTIDDIARDYLSRPCDGSMGRNTVYSYLSIAVRAYSPDDISQLDTVNRMIEVLRRNGTISEDDEVFRDRERAEYRERDERYARERAREHAAAGQSVVPMESME